MAQIEVKITDNPFGKEQLIDKIDQIQGATEVTSIPSPFAAMHLFDTAFFIANTGRYNNHKKNCYLEGTGEVLYDRLISQCLDVFEMVFFWDELNLTQRGFSFEYFAVPGFASIIGEKNKKFKQTLELYVKSYTESSPKSIWDYGYNLMHRGEVIASTSPLTGFYISASSSFSGLEIDKKTYLPGVKEESSNKFRAIGRRDIRFRSFMYAIRNQLDQFKNLKAYLENYGQQSDFITFEDAELSAYGFGNSANFLKLVEGNKIAPDKTKKNDKDIIVLPDVFSKVYMKSLLFIEKDMRFEIKKDHYKTIDDRELFGEKIPWLSANDFFEDTLVELGYEINEDRFYCCSIEGKANVQFLLPLKATYFNFFNFRNSETNENQLKERLKIICHDKQRIRKKNNEEVEAYKYIAVLKIPTTSGEVILTKEYISETSAANEYPKGRLLRLQKFQSTYLSLYPCVRDINNPENNGYYRISAYQNENTTNGQGVDLSFYKNEIDANGSLKEIKHNVTREVSKHKFQGSPVTTFYALEKYKTMQDKQNIFLSPKEEVDFDIIKLTSNVIEDKDAIDYQAIIIPKFIELNCDGTSGVVGIDFGTSNSNITFATQNGENIAASEFNTFSSTAKHPTMAFLNKNKHDRGLVNYGFDAVEGEGGMINDHFLCEYMPVDIGWGRTGYKFSIPTILNTHKDKITAEDISLVHVNIPFGYHIHGLRSSNGTLFDNPKFNFKWGGSNLSQNKIYIQLFIDQLLLMLRTMLISEGQSIKDARVVWTTPLSMDPFLKNQYAKIWNILFKKYFSNDTTISEKNLKDIDESLTPYYASSLSILGLGANTSVLLDVGGGSTDVMIYSNNCITATTSFRYAANDLFGNSRNENNVFWEWCGKEANDNKDTNDEFELCKIRGINRAGASDIINYNFITNPSFGELIFDPNERMKERYLLALHSCAILYHTFQNIHALGKKSVRTVLLSGNGSKLFKYINLGSASGDDKLKNICTTILKYVYTAKSESNEDKENKDINDEIGRPNIYFVSDQWHSDVQDSSAIATGIKAATSIGAIFWMIKETAKKVGAVKDDSEALRERIATGDSTTMIENTTTSLVKYDIQENPEIKEELIQRVKENVIHFMEGFLGEKESTDKDKIDSAFGCHLASLCKVVPINSARVWEIIRNGDKDLNGKNNLITMALEDHFLNYPQLSHSLFFPPIRAIIEKLSEKFSEK